MAAADPLQAELQTAFLMALPRGAGELDPDLSETFIATVLVDAAARRPSPEAAAFLRILAALGPPDTRRAVSGALGALTEDGFYPMDWVTEAGKPLPGQAWRRYDVFGDSEIIAVTFGYGDAEHAIAVQVDLCRLPIAIQVAVVPDAPELLDVIQRDDEPLGRVEPISLAEARRRIEAPLARCDQGRHPDLSVSSLTFLPVARARVRRLPTADAPPADRTFDAAGRAAAVDDFMASPHAAQAGADEKTMRFWAEVLTGYSGSVPGEAPSRVGPRKLSEMLLSYVPNTFALSSVQRFTMEAAVTAWTRWAAARQDLDDAATQYLADHLPKVLAGFGEAYEDPANVIVRGYLADLSATSTDASWLFGALTRRHFAVPFPEDRSGGRRARDLDAADPAQRRAIIEAEFGDCTPPGGMTSAQFLDGALRVTDQIWEDDPPQTWQAARRMLDAGTPRHDIIHDLVMHAR